MALIRRLANLGNAIVDLADAAHFGGKVAQVRKRVIKVKYLLKIVWRAAMPIVFDMIQG